MININHIKGRSLNQYETVLIIKADEIIDELVSDKYYVKKDKTYMEIDNYKIKKYSYRYNIYKNTPFCDCCKIKGEYLLAQRTKNETCNYHWNMYGIKDNGEFILLTKHKKNDNYVLLCKDCKEMIEKQS